MQNIGTRFFNCSPGSSSYLPDNRFEVFLVVQNWKTCRLPRAFDQIECCSPSDFICEILGGGLLVRLCNVFLAWLRDKDKREPFIIKKTLINDIEININD